MTPSEHISRHSFLTTERETGLADRFRQQRKKWLKAFKAFRKEITVETVHEVRIQSRRTISWLDLLRLVLPADRIDPIYGGLRREMKRASKLRDLHIQLELLGRLARHQPGFEPLLLSLRQDKKRLVKKLANALGEVKPGEFGRALCALERAYAAALARDRGESAQRIAAAVSQAYSRFHARRCRIKAQDVDSLHRVRVAFKQYRYLIDALEEARSSDSQRRDKMMQVYQARLGEIQDRTVLLNKIVKYASKHPEEADTMNTLARALRQQRNAFIQRYIAHADDLRISLPRPLLRRRVNVQSAKPVPRGRQTCRCPDAAEARK
jgi:CHAD domain-containing protein